MAFKNDISENESTLAWNVGKPRFSLEGGRLCLFADEILGQQAVVVKALPAYLRHIRKMEGLSGCTLLPDGSISLILNVGGLSNL